MTKVRTGGIARHPGATAHRASARFVTTRIAWLGIVCGATYAVFIGGAWVGIYSPWLRLMSVVIIAAGLGIWFVVARKRPGWRPRSQLLPAMLVALSSLAVSTIFSRNVRVSAEYLGYAVILAALYLLLVRLFAHPFFAARLPGLAAILFGLTAGMFVFLVVAHWVEWWTLAGRITVPPLRPDFEGLTFLNPSSVLVMVALLAIPTIATAATPSRRGAASAIAIGIVLGVVALLSGSRAGWLALALTTAIFTGIATVSSGSRAQVRARLSTLTSHRGGRIAMLASVFVVAAGAFAFGPAVLLRASEGGESLRTTYVVASLRMFEEAPLTGTGPGTWVIQRTAYTAAGEPDYYIPHAHNIEAQTLAELGLGGLVAGTVLIVSLLLLVREGMREAAPTRRRWSWATAAGLVYFALHQQLDFFANFPAALFAMALPVAYLDATSTVRRWPTALSRPASAVAAVVVTIALCGLAVQEIPASDMAAAVDEASHGDWAASDAAATNAAQLDPEVGAYQLMAGLAAAHRGDHARALSAFERVVKHNDLPEAWLDLAAEHEELGDTTGAAMALQAALRLGIQRPAVAMPAGDLALRLGLRDMATDAFAAAIRTTPSLAADPWWHQDASRESVYSDAVEAAIATGSPAAQWEIALMRGDAAGAATLANKLGHDPIARSLIDAWGGDASAIEASLDRCRLRPSDIGALNWCARLEDRSGNHAMAASWRRMSEILIGGSSALGAELRVATSAASSAGAGNLASFWATFTYRRPGPSDLLVPSLVHLTLE